MLYRLFLFQKGYIGHSTQLFGSIFSFSPSSSSRFLYKKIGRVLSSSSLLYVCVKREGGLFLLRCCLLWVLFWGGGFAKHVPSLQAAIAVYMRKGGRVLSSSDTSSSSLPVLALSAWTHREDISNSIIIGRAYSSSPNMILASPPFSMRSLGLSVTHIGTSFLMLWSSEMRVSVESTPVMPCMRRLSKSMSCSLSRA